MTVPQGVSSLARIYLVSCTKSKLPHTAEARDLYVSPRFKYARTIAEHEGDRWYVLSAAHGLLSPGETVAPYELTLRDMSASERRCWADRVAADLLRVTDVDDELVFLAGALYRDDLIARLRKRGYTRFANPLQGLRQGEQLAWLKRTATDESACHAHAQIANPAQLRVREEPAEASLERFYALVGELSRALDGGRMLGECTGRMSWPERGVYFIYEPGEMRACGRVPRVVRVGTHALRSGSRSTLWQRLHQHRGAEDGGGNHRGSVFRLHVGKALANRYPDRACPGTWGEGSSASRYIRMGELAWEREVSRHLGSMRVLWLRIDDAPTPDSDRGFIERNAIALLSTVENAKDSPSQGWLGHDAQADAIRSSGLWNVNHVGEAVVPGFLEKLEQYVRLTIEQAG